MKVTKVVQYDQVEQLTSNGWTLVCNVQNQRISTQRELEQHAHSGPHGNWIPDKYKIDTATVTETLFVMEKDAEQVEIDKGFQQKYLGSEEANRRLREEIFTLKEGARALIKERDDWKFQFDNEKASHERNEKLRKALDASLRKFEDDLGKVRKAVGELKWAEILGAKS